MNDKIKELMQQAGTDISGKWMSIDNAEKFAMLVIQAYNQEIKEPGQKTNSELSNIRIGLENI